MRPIILICCSGTVWMLKELAPLGLKEEQQPALQLLLLKLETSLIGSACIYQGEELALQDSRDIPLERMQDPWGIEFAPVFLGRDTCRTPMVWRADASNGEFSRANSTWLPVDQNHLQRAALDEAGRSGSVYNEFAEFLKWKLSLIGYPVNKHFVVLLIFNR